MATLPVRVRAVIPALLLAMLFVVAVGGIAYAVTCERCGEATEECVCDTWQFEAQQMVGVATGAVGSLVTEVVGNPILLLGLGIVVFGIVAGFIRRVIPGA